ncbi:MAG: hypothetical protein JWM86_284 [Thermoleophilia bacterium]|nr:hypothetical protein [Thermoleophilia bacterium]
MPSHAHQARHACLRAVALIACVLAVGTAAQGEAATGSSSVGATVLSATSLDVTGCTGADLDLGAFNPLNTSITSTPCDVIFGSSNNTSALRVFQADGDGAALTQLDPAAVKHTGGIDFEGVTAKDASEAWMVGKARRTGDPTPVVHTIDGGVTWINQTSCNPTAALNDVDYVSAGTVVSVGTGQLICRTTDSGSNWVQVTSPSNGVWHAVDILATGEGWIVGANGRVAKTIDGGATWSSLPVGDPTWQITEVTAASNLRLYASAFISGSPRTIGALTSGDGGATWSFTSLGTAGTGWAYGVASTSATTAVVGTSLGKFRTAYSGATWTLVDTVTAATVCALDATNLMSFNSPTAAVRRSNDSGATWSTVPSPSPYPGNIFGCAAGSSTTMFYGGYNDNRGRSTDAGLTFTVTPTTYRTLRGGDAWSNQAWVAVGDLGAVRRTSNAGATVSMATSGVSTNLQDVVALEGNVAVAVGASGTIIRSTDRGATWTTVAPVTATSLVSIDDAPDGTLFALSSTVLLRSSDAGLTWTAVTAPVGSGMSQVTAMSSARIWVGTITGAIHATSDGGATWVPQPTSNAYAIVSLDARSDTAVLASTDRDDTSLASRILRTSDGGSTWATTTAPNDFSYDVRWLSPTEAVVGESNGYRRSTDGGATWSSTQTVGVNMFAVAALDTNSFILVGEGDFTASIRPSSSFANYVNGSVDFSGTASTFGACLQTAAGTATTLWPVAGLGNCTAANLANWRGVAIDAAGTTAKVASTATSGTGVLAFKFGAKPGATQKPGAYSAQLVWEVVAPDA